MTMQRASFRINKLLVVTHVPHYRFDGRLFAYGPYVREIDVWADLFPEVIIAAQCSDHPPTGGSLPFTRPNIRVLPQRIPSSDNFMAKFARILSLPVLVLNLGQAMRQADAIHVRCPGNLGLLGALMAPLFSRYMIAKFAGNWAGHPGEDFTVRLQRKILSSVWWRGPVTVYGRWPGQPPNIIPFFSSIMTADQMDRARAASARKHFGSPLQIIYVGRLSKAKNVDKLLTAIAVLKEQAIQVLCKVVGEGPQLDALKEQVAVLGLSSSVEFTGGVDFDKVLDYYEQADVLVLASETEGWPKAIVEAMSFGLICIGANRGWVPEILGEGRGIVIPPGEVDALVNALRSVAGAPGNYQVMSSRAAAWAEKYSLEGLRDALRDLINESWYMSLEPRDRSVAKVL